MGFWKPAGKSSVTPPRPRLHHYLFAHRALPSQLWAVDSVLGILADPRNSDFTVEVWQQIGNELSPSERLPYAGLTHSSYWIGGEHLVILVSMPPALFQTEAHFVVITTSPTIRYITLEAGGQSGTEPKPNLLCEWTEGTHKNCGTTGAITANDFLLAACRLLSTPEKIDNPLPIQQQGLRKGTGTMIFGDVPPELSPVVAAQMLTWKTDAEAATSGGDHAKAERLYREMLHYSLQELGPENARATVIHGNLAFALLAQGKYQNAEAVCMDWWKLCRRYRMLGHSETLSVLSTIADCLRGQRRQQEARAFLAYRAQLAGLARGTNHPFAQRAKLELTSIHKSD